MRQAELDAIKEAADARGIDWRLVAAIRVAENGLHDDFHGAPFGVVADPNPEHWRANLEICANSVRNALLRFGAVVFDSVAGVEGHNRLVYAAPVLSAIGKRYSPPDINPHWLDNVAAAYARLATAGPGWLLETR